ncbi:MAG: hypothetical protein ACI9SE_001884, partial [Neolewinella sp.]
MRIARLGLWVITVSVGLLLQSCSAPFDERSPIVASGPAIDFLKPDTVSGVHGRLETHEGLRVLRLWGTSEQRGYAHGFLVASDIFAIMNQEFAARFAEAPELLVQARAALPRLIEYPDEFA